MSFNENQYLKILQELVDKAEDNPIRSDRTGVGTWSVFGRTIEFDLTDMKIPLLTTKKINYSNILHELYWMFRLKNENTDYLDENNEWKDDGLTVGPLTNHFQTQCFSILIAASCAQHLSQESCASLP